MVVIALMAGIMMDDDDGCHDSSDGEGASE